MKATMTRALLVPLMFMALAGCGRDEDGAGPAQRIGKTLDDAGAKVTGSVQDELARVDDAVVEARNKVKDATEEASRGLDRATEEVGKSVERAGQKIQDKADEINGDD